MNQLAGFGLKQAGMGGLAGALPGASKEREQEKHKVKITGEQAAAAGNFMWDAGKAGVVAGYNAHQA